MIVAYIIDTGIIAVMGSLLAIVGTIGSYFLGVNKTKLMAENNDKIITEQQKRIEHHGGLIQANGSDIAVLKKCTESNEKKIETVTEKITQLNTDQQLLKQSLQRMEDTAKETNQNVKDLQKKLDSVFQEVLKRG